MMEEMMEQEVQDKILPDMKKEKKYFSKLGLMYFLGTVLIFAVQLGIGQLILFLVPAWQNNVNMVFLVTMLPMYIIAMPLMMLLICRIPAQKMETHKMSLGKLIIAFFMCYAIMYISNIVGNIVTMIIGAIKGGGVANVIGDVAGSVSPWVTVLTMVLITPVMEELLFRKLLADRLVKYGEGVAVVVSALMFGLFHGNLNQFAYAFTLGLFLAFIYVKTGKIIYSIILHMIINFLGSVVSLWVLEQSNVHEMQNAVNMAPEKIMEMLPNLMILLVYFVFLFAIVIAGTVLLILKRKKFVMQAGEITIPKGKRFSTIFVNVGMLLFTVGWLIMIIAQLFM